MSDCSFAQRVLNIILCDYSAVWLLHGWCHAELLPSRRTFCVNHTTMYQFTLYSKPLTLGACMFRYILPLRFWQNDWDRLRIVYVLQR